MLLIEDAIKPIKGSSLNLKPIMDDFENRYSEHIANKISYKIGLDTKQRRYIAFKVPTEHSTKYMSELYYDVLIEFIPSKIEHFEARTLKKCPIKLYSNCPSFTFTFTYVYKKLNALAGLQGRNKFSKKGLKKAPAKRNPIGISGIEKTIWFSIYKMGEDNLFDKKVFDSFAEPSFTKFKSYVRKFKSQEEKLEEINKTKKKDKKKGNKKVKKKKAKLDRSKNALYNNDLKSNNLKGSLKSSLKREASFEGPKSLVGMLNNKSNEFISNFKSSLRR